MIASSESTVVSFVEPWDNGRTSIGYRMNHNWIAITQPLDLRGQPKDNDWISDRQPATLKPSRNFYGDQVDTKNVGSEGHLDS